MVRLVGRSHCSRCDLTHARVWSPSAGGVSRVAVATPTKVHGLAMTRSVGDVMAKAAGVVSTPETAHLELCSSHRAVILASDGVRVDSMMPHCMRVR